MGKWCIQIWSSYISGKREIDVSWIQNALNFRQEITIKMFSIQVSFRLQNTSSPNSPLTVVYFMVRVNPWTITNSAFSLLFIIISSCHVFPNWSNFYYKKWRKTIISFLIYIRNNNHSDLHEKVIVVPAFNPFYLYFFSLTIYYQCFKDLHQALSVCAFLTFSFFLY